MPAPWRAIDSRLAPWLEQFLYDVRFGCRTLLKSPGFTATVILTLALATGATTAIFSIVNSVLLKPLPFARPEQLVQVEEIAQVGGPGAVLPQDLEEFRKQSTTFETLAGYGLTTRHVLGSSGAERLNAVISDHHFFTLLGVQPIAGRTFRVDDTEPLVVISERMWTRRFTRDPSVVSSTIALEGNRFDPTVQRTIIDRRAHTIVGVMPAAFQFPYGAGSVYAAALPEGPTDIWLLDNTPRRLGRARVTGRLKPGVTIADAAAELSLIEQRLDVSMPSPYRPTGVRLVALADDVLGEIRGSLWILFGAVGLVLAAACANVANLSLARMTARTREVVTRAAVGAGRWRLVRQLLTESLVLSVAGGAAGIAVAWWGTNLLVAVGTAKIPRAHEVALDWTVFVFLLLVCLATATLFGLAPALMAARVDVQAITKEVDAHTTTSGRFARIRDGLVVTEVALAFVLAFGAALVISELNRLRSVDAGIGIENVLTFHLTPRVDEASYYRIEERVAQVAGVESCGLIHMVPLQNWGGIGTFQVRGRPPQDASRLPTAELRSITPGYFQTLRIPILMGRALAERERLDTPAAILVNATLAQQQFPGESPIGRELDRGNIVGVVGDVRQTSLDQPAAPQIYSLVGPTSGIAPDIGMSLVVRTRRIPETVVDSVRAAVREVTPNIAIFNVRTMEQVVSDSLWELNLYTWLIGLFAGLALTLSAIGLYGVISYSVAWRTREFAIRVALGSDHKTVARLVVMRGLFLGACGLALGVLAALAFTLLFPDLPVKARLDPALIVPIGALVLGLSVLASVVPALRVAALDPVTALRHE